MLTLRLLFDEDKFIVLVFWERNKRKKFSPITFTFQIILSKYKAENLDRVYDLANIDETNYIGL